MGVFDKLKKVLFDEEEIEVPIDSDELPERQPKKVEENKSSNAHIIDYHNDEEDTIKEIKVPEDDKELEDTDSRIKFPIDDFEDVEELPSRSSIHEKYEETTYENVRSRREMVEEKSVEYHRDLSPLTPRAEELKKEIQEHNKPKEDPKDYKKILEASDENGKKPFKVSPIISPVFGVLEKNYTPEEVTEKREMISKINSGVKPRTFGPVSYNDAPLPGPHKYAKNKTSLKEDLVELNTTVSEIINDTVNSASISEDNIDIPAYANTNEMVDIIDDDDPILVTENYNEITADIPDVESIEKEYLDNNNIEDAFETTSEYEKIDEQDNAAIVEPKDDYVEPIEEQEPTQEIPTYEAKEEIIEEDPETENLDDTIETDLFHLIDSMYQSKEDEESEEEE